jgi:cell division protein FtsB
MDQRQLNKQIEEKEAEKKYLKEETTKDIQSIKLLKNQDQVEKYGREKYHMKKPNEDIYIIEYEGDTIKK